MVVWFAINNSFEDMHQFYSKFTERGHRVKYRPVDFQDPRHKFDLSYCRFETYLLTG